MRWISEVIVFGRVPAIRNHQPRPSFPLAIDPSDSRIVFVGSTSQSERFVADIAPRGGALEHATCFLRRRAPAMNPQPRNCR